HSRPTKIKHATDYVYSYIGIIEGRQNFTTIKLYEAVILPPNMSVTASDSQTFSAVITDNAGQGVLVGGGAWITTYVITAILAIIDGISGNLPLGWEVPAWKLYALIVYNSHFANLVSVDTVTGKTESLSLFRDDPVREFWPTVGQTLPQIIYRLVPIIVLVVAGYLIVQRIESPYNPPTAAIVGSTISIGYGALAI
ncbi:MAG: hypothetical protein ABEI86_01885, partial [Halobacteriaceae archaeon]